jgi:hypothetical protein
LKRLPRTPRRVPPLIPIPVIAKATGYSYEYARGLLERSSVLQRDGRRFWKARRGLLRERLPDIYEDVFAYYELPETWDNAPH